MATNRVYEGYRIPVVCSHPTTPLSGNPVRCGDLTGIAIVDEGDGGNTTTGTSVDFGPGVWAVVVSGVDGSGASNVALYDPLYYVDATAPILNKNTAGKLFGYALGTVTSSTSGRINVMKHMP
jgi:predicted RecA/RadA family phage recombinase